MVRIVGLQSLYWGLGINQIKKMIRDRNLVVGCFMASVWLGTKAGSVAPTEGWVK